MCTKFNPLVIALSLPLNASANTEPTEDPNTDLQEVILF